MPADNAPLQNLRLLSPAEQNIVSYIQAGKSSKEIAELLHISKKLSIIIARTSVKSSV
ncbi:LuxR C-terminal-related transcriptional regulator [Aliamphritea spongicola]|nr:LuxR C-terminal-related transcriptional regulator [Aliamphritea spongicola]